MYECILACTTNNSTCINIVYNFIDFLLIIINNVQYDEPFILLIFIGQTFEKTNNFNDELSIFFTAEIKARGPLSGCVFSD